MSSSPLSELPAGVQSAVASGSRPCDHAQEEPGITELTRLWNWMADLGRKWVHCPHQAEDIAGEAVERAWMQFGDSLRWDLHRRWVARTARNFLINARKRQRDCCRDMQ